MFTDSKRKEQIHALLKSIDAGDKESIAVVNSDKYIQHNPQAHEGGEAAVLFKRLSKSFPRILRCPPAKAFVEMSILPSMIYFVLQAARLLSIGILAKRFLLAASGRMIMGSSNLAGQNAELNQPFFRWDSKA